MEWTGRYNIFLLSKRQGNWISSTALWMHFCFPPPLHVRLCCLDPLRFIADKQASEPTADALNGGFHTVLHLILMMALYGAGKREYVSFCRVRLSQFFSLTRAETGDAVRPHCARRECAAAAGEFLKASV